MSMLLNNIDPVKEYDLERFEARLRVMNSYAPIQRCEKSQVLGDSVLDINAVIYGLIFLLHSPNGNDPLNHDAAKHFRENPRSFEQAVRTTLTGGSVRFDGKTTTGFKRLI